jgi:hypothetical protein
MSLIQDPSSGTAASVKPPSTAPQATDQALVVSISPNTPGFPVTGTVSVSNFPSTQAVTQSGIWSTGRTWDLSSSTDSVTIVPSGTQTVSGTVAATQSGIWTVQPGNTPNSTAWLVTGTGGTFPVTGTFWQTTQPISAASLPLPTGAATSSNQTTLGTQTTEINDGTRTAAIAAASTAATAAQTSLIVAISPNSPVPTGSNNIGSITNITGTVSLPTGAATSSNQTTIGSQTTEINDGTHTAAIKAASTAAVASDTSLVIAVSPNSPLPTGANVIGAVTQSGGPWTENLTQISGSAISTAATGVQKVGITGNTGAAMDAAGQNAASPVNELLIAGQFNTTPTTITTGNISPLQLDSAANLLVNLKTALPAGANNIGSITNITGTVSLPTGAATSANQTTLGSQTTEINDGTHTAAIKAASTAAVATDTSLVIAVSPNSPLPTGTNNVGSITNITGTVSLPTGAATSANQTTVGTQTTQLNDGTRTAAIAAASTAATAAQTSLIVALSPNSPLPAGASTIGVVNQGTAATLANAWSQKITDGTNGPAAVKAASTAAVATDPSLVVALSPNSTLYDSFTNPMLVKNRVSMPATQGVSPVSGLETGLINRTLRVGPTGTLRNTTEILAWHDAIEGTTVNAFWTQSTTTMTIAQTTGVLTLNNSGITTASTDAIITSQRQFERIPKSVLHWHTRANITSNSAANQTVVEMGFGAPAGTTATITTGSFFRWTAAGVLNGVLSFNGTEASTQLLAQGTISTTSYYRYDVFVEDEFVRFIVTDSNDVPIVDTQVQVGLAIVNQWSVSHLPSFARVYSNATGGGTAIKLNISAHAVYALDIVNAKPWQQQMSAIMRHGSINPVTYAQTASSMTAAPATETPSNTAAGYATLGGDYATALTVASENPLSVFAFQIPSPYSFYLTELQFSTPFVTTTIGVTGVPVLEWLIIANCASSNISTGGGQRMPVGLNILYASATQPAGGFCTAQGNLTFNPDVPILCLPGTFLHIAYKVFITSAAATPGVTRGSVYVDGYFE